VPPAIDLEAERALQELVVALAADRVIRSAHDCSDGGLAVTLAECCFDTAGVGAEVSLTGAAVSRDGAVNDAATLFGESASRVVVSVAPDGIASVLERAAASKVPARVIGQVAGNRLRMAVDGRMVIDRAVDELERVWSSAVESYFAKRVA
jgi:phosphoribosylformylglycinamidine synthase